MMTRSFNFKRFTLLVKKQALERGKLYLMALAIVSVIIIAFYGVQFWNYTKYYSTNNGNSFSSILQFREPLFCILGLFFLSISTSHYFIPLGDKPKAIYDITFPAARLEKFLVAILYSTVLAILSYLLLFLVIDYTFITLLGPEKASTNYIALNGIYRPKILENSDFTFIKYEILTTIDFGIMLSVASSFSLIIAAIFLLGSIYFERYQYIKTHIVGYLFMALAGLFYYFAYQLFFLNKTSIEMAQSGPNKSVAWLSIVLLFLIALFFFIVTYIRYKEKEV